MEKRNEMLYNNLMEQESKIRELLQEEVAEEAVEEAKEDCFLMLLERWQDNPGTSVTTDLLRSIVKKVAVQYNLQCAFS